MHKITVISKHGCHLCENTISILESLRKKRYVLEVLYIEDDAALYDSYWLRVPVVRLDGKVVYDALEISFPGEDRKKLESMVLALEND